MMVIIVMVIVIISRHGHQSRFRCTPCLDMVSMGTLTETFTKAVFFFTKRERERERERERFICIYIYIYIYINIYFA